MEKNVKEFVEQCAERLGNYSSDEFKIDLEYIEKHGYGRSTEIIESPIEQILFAAILFKTKMNNLRNGLIEIGDFYIVDEIEIEPQFLIGKYKVDFKITNQKSIYSKKENKTIDISRSILVECDSQQWHERTEKERRYEKARDRYFTKKNLKIFHYTGTEITEQPFEVASEILQEVTGFICL